MQNETNENHQILNFKNDSRSNSEGTDGYIFFEESKKDNTQEETPPDLWLTDDDENLENNEIHENVENIVDIEQERLLTPSPKMKRTRELKGLRSYNKPGRGEIMEFAFSITLKEGKDDEPKSFNEAWNHENVTHRAKWREAF